MGMRDEYRDKLAAMSEPELAEECRRVVANQVGRREQTWQYDLAWQESLDRGAGDLFADAVREAQAARRQQVADEKARAMQIRRLT